MDDVGIGRLDDQDVVGLPGQLTQRRHVIDGMEGKRIGRARCYRAIGIDHEEGDVDVEHFRDVASGIGRAGDIVDHAIDGEVDVELSRDGRQFRFAHADRKDDGGIAVCVFTFAVGLDIIGDQDFAMAFVDANRGEIIGHGRQQLVLQLVAMGGEVHRLKLRLQRNVIAVLEADLARHVGAEVDRHHGGAGQRLAVDIDALAVIVTGGRIARIVVKVVVVEIEGIVALAWGATGIGASNAQALCEFAADLALILIILVGRQLLQFWATKAKIILIDDGALADIDQQRGGVGFLVIFDQFGKFTADKVVIEAGGVETANGVEATQAAGGVERRKDAAIVVDAGTLVAGAGTSGGLDVNIGIGRGQHGGDVDLLPI
nr:H339 [uncultured bacterium]